MIYTQISIFMIKKIKMVINNLLNCLRIYFNLGIIRLIKKQEYFKQFFSYLCWSRKGLKLVLIIIEQFYRFSINLNRYNFLAGENKINYVCFPKSFEILYFWVLSIFWANFALHLFF